MPIDGDALQEWSQLHDGYDVQSSLLVRRWVLAMHAVAAPLARWRVPPTAVTLAGVTAASAAVASTRVMAAVLVLVTSVCDGVDGALARRLGTAGRGHGALIDHAADRVTDVLFAAALWHAGALAWVAIAAAVTTIGYELARSMLRRAQPRLAFVTVGERPIRVVVVAAGIVVAPAIAAGAIAALCAGSCAQLAVAGCPRTRSGG